MRNVPELVEVDSTRLEEVLRRVEQSLDEKDAALVRAVFESYAYVSDLVEDKNTSIRRLLDDKKVTARAAYDKAIDKTLFKDALAAEGISE